MNTSYLIYLIEDNPIDTLIAKRLLHTLSITCQLHCFYSGKQALQALETLVKQGAGFPDTILLDLEMPLFSGWDFLDSYHEREAFLSKPCRIYILSASINSRDRLKAKDYQAVVDFIIKPLRVNQLHTILKE